MRKRLLEKTKVMFGALVLTGTLVTSVNPVLATQEEYTAGSSMGKECDEAGDYDDEAVPYSVDAEEDEVLAQAGGSGWQSDSNGWWFKYPDGTYATGWLKLGDDWYYLNTSGYMLTGSHLIDSNWYYFADSGEMLTGWQKNSGGWWYYNSNGAYVASTYADGKVKGIDVSYYQKDIDWNAVKSDGIDFAILRVSASYYSDTYHHFTDKRFNEYATNANAAGMPVGAYIYSKARSVDNAISDAEYVINELKGHIISYPVAIDLEDKSQTDLSKETLGAIAKAFCDEIRKAGYTPMVYCNENWYKNYIDVSQIAGEEKWIARYNSHYDTNIPRGIWQCSSTTRINGIKGNVDLDFASNFYGRDKWVNVDGAWYYLNSNSQKSRGWMCISGSWYYFSEEGVMQTGWQEIDGNWYYLTENGNMLTGWQRIGNSWFYLTVSGNMVTGWIYDGAWYYFNAGGAMSVGWEEVDGSWYLFSAGGQMLTGWRYMGNTWYYFTPSGNMLTGWQVIDGKWYYFADGGEMLTGWQLIDGIWYLMDQSGKWIC